ncbi:tumor necrosis factor ligand superfamily member 13B-like [Scyliorhinus canicula]|uniref:tumor necrosis factor ligand superfamily member 13B-like n=1 Tax=Scyliorhinus canicula TaxID=7830 RepID=UPI0018F5B396|nr:tumor necrosis factor ligand superfamily member 13B-like [Scyliorhinus canicula]
MKADGGKAGIDVAHRCLIYSACVLTTAALLSASMAAVALHHVLALKAEISSMREELGRYKYRLEQLGSWARGTEEGQAANWSRLAGQAGGLRGGTPASSREKPAEGEGRFRGGRSLPDPVRQSFVQLIATANGRPVARASRCQKCIAGRHQQACRVERRPFANRNQVEETTIPWILSLRKGGALEKTGDKISVRETGYFLVYSQVWYKDDTFTMGHLIKRIKASIVGNEPQSAILFRCIQNMPACCPNNSCFTAGIAKLEVGDELELIVPRGQAHIALTGDGTFFGVLKLS